MSHPLTHRQQTILAYIQRYHETHGYVPAIREICQACAISSTSVARYNLLALQREGYVAGLGAASRGVQGSGRARGYHLVRPELVVAVPAWLDDEQRRQLAGRLRLTVSEYLQERV